MNLALLTQETLGTTQRVAQELFPWEHEHQVALPAALAPKAYAEFYRLRGLETVRCWTALDQERVCGMATLYGYNRRPEELWLAWFGLRSQARGRGVGQQMLDWLLGLAAAEGRRILRLWTTDEPEYEKAVRLYLRRGFTAETVEPLPGEDWKTLVFSLSLDGRPVSSWTKQARGERLCGRENPQANAFAA